MSRLFFRTKIFCLLIINPILSKDRKKGMRKIKKTIGKSKTLAKQGF
jgi:hypothetical protein